MASLNKVMLIGNLTRDPEVRYTPKGVALAEIGIAINRIYTTDSGERREDVTFVDVTLWDKKAETVAKFLKKGSPIYIEGRLQLDSWDDKTTGKKQYKLRVVGDNFQFLGGPRDGAASGGGEDHGGDGGSYSQRPASRPAARPASAQRPPQARPAPGGNEFGEGPITDGLEDDDIPF